MTKRASKTKEGGKEKDKDGEKTLLLSSDDEFQ